jgi:hypothetical protein
VLVDLEPLWDEPGNFLGVDAVVEEEQIVPGLREQPRLLRKRPGAMLGFALDGRLPRRRGQELGDGSRVRNSSRLPAGSNE